MVNIMSQMCVIDGESLHNMTPLDSFSKCKQLSVLDVTQLQDFEKKNVLFYVMNYIIA